MIMSDLKFISLRHSHCFGVWWALVGTCASTKDNMLLTSSCKSPTNDSQVTDSQPANLVHYYSGVASLICMPEVSSIPTAGFTYKCLRTMTVPCFPPSHLAACG